jgi:hypothetical protein
MNIQNFSKHKSEHLVEHHHHLIIQELLVGSIVIKYFKNILFFVGLIFAVHILSLMKNSESFPGHLMPIVLIETYEQVNFEPHI